MPSLIKIVENEFNCNKYFTNFKFRDNGNTFEIDMLGISEQFCYVIEVKSNLKINAIEQLINSINKFKIYMPEYSHLKVYGIIAATTFSNELMKNVMKNGFYFISLSDDLAKLKKSRDFKPKIW